MKASNDKYEPKSRWMRMLNNQPLFEKGSLMNIGVDDNKTNSLHNYQEFAIKNSEALPM